VTKAGSVARSSSRGDSIPLDYDTSSLVNAPQQRRSQELSMRILEAAERVLRRGGPQAFTINAVAAEAGVSVGGIYGRFQNREELLTAIHEKVLTMIQHHVEALTSRQFDSLRALITAFSSELVGLFQGVGGLIPTVQGTGAGRTVLTVERAIRTALAKGAEPFRHEIRHPDPDLALRLTVHLLLASVVREAMTDPTATDRTIGWQNLHRELPRVARAILMSAD
jgi:AcrR family transcriptional regulator